MLPLGSTEIDGMLFNISTADEPDDEISFSTLKINLLLANSIAFFSAFILISFKTSVFSSNGISPKLILFEIVVLLNVFVL